MEEQLKCDACGVTFEDEDEYEKHLENEHGGAEQPAGADQDD
jgi:uncharacterized C2H2 Zn-finger protein